ncbi:MAG: release factor glutamine methyltransferase [Ilumatobacteraceae bacterium]
MPSPPTNEPANSPAMDDGTITWGELWNDTAARIGSPRARWLCEVASGFDGEELLASLGLPASQRCVAQLDSMLGRLDAGEPLQYVLGRWGFRHLDLLIDRRVLIPRPETELVVEVALRIARSLQPPITCADLGTGSGAIGLSLATELPLGDASVWMTDCSTGAIDVARANAAGVGRAAAHVRFAQGDWFDALPEHLRGELDLVVSNPPYVGVADEGLEPIVRDWEPPEALFAGPDGLDEIRRLVADAPQWLRRGGWLVMEIGSTQGPSVGELLTAAGFDDVDISADLTSHDRIAVARLSG